MAAVLKEMNGQFFDIPPEFQDDPEIAHAVELAKESAYTAEELEMYDAYLDALRVEGTVRADAYGAGKAEGEQIGIKKGRREEKMNLARKMLEQGTALQQVSDLTGLALEEIKLLKS